MNPEKLRTKEFSKIYADLQEIKRMPTFLGDLEFREEIRQMQILFAWHLLNRRLENLRVWRTNKAFSFLNIQRFAQEEKVKERQKQKFQNKVLSKKLRLSPNPPEIKKIKKEKSSLNFQKSRLE
jgi:hypothetical protein